MNSFFSAMINAGIGPTHVCTFLSSLNIPPPHQSTLFSRQKEAFDAVIETAKDSCKRALVEEVTLTQTDPITPGDESANELGGLPLTVSYDAGWSKRGTGRSYDSNIGHGVLIGKSSRKCLDFSVRSKVCDTCDRAQRSGVIPKEHKCYKNWTGSSKAMEPDMAVDMIQNIQSTGLSVGTLVMDNDSTTIAKVREVNPLIEKLSDKNHTKKSISNALYALSNTHSVLKNRKTLNYVLRMFMYAIEQNQGNVEGLQKRLSEIVRHMYGCHEQCSGEWCTYSDNPEKFAHNSLPYKKPLQDKNLSEALHKLVQQYIAKADRLAYQGSSQANESFNNIVASKAPKAR